VKRVPSPGHSISPTSSPSARGWLAIVLSLGVLALATACSGDGGHRRGPATTAAAPTQAATTTTTPGGTPSDPGALESPTVEPILADGRHPVYLTDLDPSRRTVTFDLIQFLTGAEAAKVWAKAHPDEPDGPPNDYLIINDNRRLRTLPIADTARVTVATDASGGIANVQITMAELPAHLARQRPESADGRLSYAPYWLTVRGGQVTGIDEQFLP
jgi:hypothetical protein